MIFIIPSSEFGGHEMQTLEIAQSYYGMSINIVFMIRESNVKMICACENDGFSVIPYSRNIDLIFNLRKHSGEVLFSTGSIFDNLSTGLLLRLFSKKMIVYIPYVHERSSKIMLVRHIKNFLTKFVIFRFYSNVITIHEIYAKRVKDYGAKNVLVLRNEIYMSKTFDKISGVLPRLPSESEYVVGVIGRILFAQKAQNLVVAMINECINELSIPSHKIIKVIFFGDGPDKDKLQNLIDDSRNLNVRIETGLSSSEIYPMIDLLLIPSHFEGVPRVLLEALSIDKPVLCSSFETAFDYVLQDYIFDIDTENGRLNFANTINALATQRIEYIFK